ncbi:hypothetical protein E2320_000465 [Naja naja]|nr:hypothetical protein E2320_000465 [Naja naja]
MPIYSSSCLTAHALEDGGSDLSSAGRESAVVRQGGWEQLATPPWWSFRRGKISDVGLRFWSRRPLPLPLAAPLDAPTLRR